MRTFLWSVIAAFPVSEIVLAIRRRADTSAADVQDQGSMRLLWLAIAAGVALAITCQWATFARIHMTAGLYYTLTLLLMIAGLAIRWTAILTLGRLFTVDVATHRDHALVQTGLFRWIRHPSYAGLLLAFLGLGVFFSNWLSIVALLVPIALAVVNRIAIEEKALLGAVGPSYAAYCLRTKRLIPGAF